MARLSVQFDGSQSTVVDQFSQTPLQLHRPLYLEGSSHPTVYIVTPSSGLLGGDEHCINVIVEPRAQLDLRTQAATQVYPGSSLLQINLQVKDFARLVFLPHPIILGAQASLQQSVRIELGEGATISFADTWCAGRVGMQELFRFADYEYRLEIFQRSKLAYRESWRIAPEETTLKHPMLCGDYTHFASFYQFGERANFMERENFADLKSKSFETETTWALERDGNEIYRRAYRFSSDG